MNSDEFEADYDDLASDVLRAGHTTFQRRLQGWLDLLDTSPYSAERIKELGTKVDFDSWYSEALKTVRSMVGSGDLTFARDRTQKLAQELALFRNFAEDPEGYVNFCMSFLYTGNGFDEMVSGVNDQYFEPFQRDLLKDLKRSSSAASSPIAPASDRVVSLDHNSSAYQQAAQGVNWAVATLEASNTIAADEPEERNRVLYELAAGKTLLGSKRVRTRALWELLYPALVWIRDRAVDAAAVVAIDAAIKAIALMCGVHLG